MLLAAGRGSRFDPSGERSKLLHTLGSGPVVSHAASGLLEVCEVVLAVIRPHSPELKLQLEQAGCQVIECADAHLGMGHSLAWGLAEAERIYQPDILVVMLGDMPYVKSSTIQSLINVIDGDVQAVAPEFLGKRGNPWVFGKQHFEALKRCSGDRGAAVVLDPKDVHLIKVDDPGVLRDIDSLGDIEAATSSTRGATEATAMPTESHLPKPD
jgi:molybdenum cofactor cytidylyltransferase